MLDLSELLELAKYTAVRGGSLLADADPSKREYVHDTVLLKEIKATADVLVEAEILRALAPVGLTIWSEEAGRLEGTRHAEYRFIVDPLDGTFNYVKRLGPSAVSIALWKNETPVFGVLFLHPEASLVWGGPGIGAFRDGAAICVSATRAPSRAVICTGFPVRMNVTNDTERERFWSTAEAFAKVRMLGSAAASLANVASGCADVYAELGIMHWDVAAGLAIVQGAGGDFRMECGVEEHSLNVVAGNHDLLDSW
jgi:myo-inositol-1(or 4)-monophosphatase